jgi:hypothetical protein
MSARAAVRLAITLAAALLLCLPSPSAEGKPTKKETVEAKQAAKDAKRAEKNKDFEAAKQAYERALELTDSAAYRLDLARVEAELGHLLAAEKLCEAVRDGAAVSAGHKKRASKALERLDQRTPRLQVVLPSGFQGELSVDNQAVMPSDEPLRLDPGEHVVSASASGSRPFEKTVSLAEGESQTVTVELAQQRQAAAPPPDAEPEVEREKEEISGGTPTLAIVSLVAGGVGLAIGTGFALAAQSTRDELRQSCQDDVCNESQREVYDRGRQQADIATTGFLVGGVGVGMGLALLLFGSSDEPQRPAEATLSPTVGIGRVGVQGRF